MQMVTSVYQNFVYFITNGAIRVNILMLKNQTTYLWCDPKLKIRWPIKKPILSKRDKKAKAI